MIVVAVVRPLDKMTLDLSRPSFVLAKIQVKSYKKNEVEGWREKMREGREKMDNSHMA